MTHILVVDDSALIRNKLTTILHNLGCTVEHAIHGQDALEKVKNQVFDCVFSDLLMPVMDGFQFLEEVKKIYPALPVVVVSADIQELTRERCLKLGALGVLPKPPKEQDVKELLSTVPQ